VRGSEVPTRSGSWPPSPCPVQPAANTSSNVSVRYRMLRIAPALSPGSRSGSRGIYRYRAPATRE